MRSCPAASTPCVWDAGGFHTHFQCVSLCGRRNASLPCVRSAEEAAAIAAAAVGTEWAWVGLYQLTEDRHGIDQGWERVAQCTGVDNHTERVGEEMTEAAGSPHTDERSSAGARRSWDMMGRLAART